jgi:WD40 repeat protein
MAFVAERPPLIRSLPSFMRPLLSRIVASLIRKSRECLVTGGLDGNLMIWDPENGENLQTIKSAHSESIEEVVAGADGLFASGSQDRNIRLWRMNRRVEPDGILFLGLMVSDLAISPKGDLLAAALRESSKNELVLWDLKSRIPVGGGFQIPEEIGSVAFGPSGDSLYLAGKGISAWWDLQPKTWSSRACDMVRRDFSSTERDKYLKPSEPSAVCRRDK